MGISWRELSESLGKSPSYFYSLRHGQARPQVELIDELACRMRQAGVLTSDEEEKEFARQFARIPVRKKKSPTPTPVGATVGMRPKKNNAPKAGAKCHHGVSPPGGLDHP